ncbi:DUF1697 domain-containing protein [Novosphingobium mangrovi (ex Huang et al. 2023)]|uniref:DUF1697 domain-containing protein n=1 Tax=Novosphingobium mangrovi (ex Huang et al. 2023) TaxID=2976432 RepID=A0ABT2I206_9SPHN|nr:DUF1697 domain-containing protein [Novosphingobium mangrovi (ex Huang et al. 2023)]MCT2398840.1 DUF1697 domain-containing protein [Novosphingobium mangrovi (ex Huang et al. 2023)]
MTRYLALFGSINVGGNRLTMADLRYAFEREEFENVETVVASGNVLFDFDERPTDGLEELFAHMMLERFDIDSFVAVRTKGEVRAAVEDNPFVGSGEDKFVHTHFLESQPEPARFEKLLADHAGRGNEKLAMGPRCLYIDYVDGVGNSKLTAAFIERRLGCRGTARNARSLARILSKM